MGIIGTIFIGLIVGLLARFLKPGDDSMGWIMTILLGIGGSLAATYGGQALGIYQAGEGAGFIGALVGAVVLAGDLRPDQKELIQATKPSAPHARGLECSAIHVLSLPSTVMRRLLSDLLACWAAAWPVPANCRKPTGWN